MHSILFMGIVSQPDAEASPFRFDLLMQFMPSSLIKGWAFPD
jgi:hypothetical protein